MKPIFFIAENEEQYWNTVKDDVLFSIKESLTKYQDCRIGLAGGSTPERLYKMLVEENLPWGKIKLILVDERYVASDDNESNLKMIRNALINHVSIPPENIFSFDTSLPQVSAAKEMSRKLTALLAERHPLFDLLILGAGEDGHVASLFEGDSAVNSTYYADVAYAKDYPTKERLTLTLIPLKNADKVFLLLKGEKKTALFKELESGNSKHYALNQVLDSEYAKVYYGL
jgi:6-phosphogluconolactonase